MLTLNDGRAELWQWDTGRTLAVDADCSQVHFSNKVFGRSIDVDVVDGVAIIPDVLLQTDKDLNVWAFVGTADNGYTKISKTFTVNRRNKPADYVFTPTEQTTIAEIAAIAQSVRDDADAGLFNGKPGENGADGYSPTANVTQDDNGATITITDKNGTTTATVTNGKDGADGKPGADGRPGNDGADGKSAYAYAVEGGYTGTETEFAAKLAQEMPTTLPNPNALTFTGAVTGSYDGSAPLTVEIPSGGSEVPKPLTYDYMPGGYPKKAMGTVTLLEEQELGFQLTSDHENYGAGITNQLDIVEGQTYTVNWDGTEYECVGFTMESESGIGNLSILGLGEDTGEPFLCGYRISEGITLFLTPDTSATHTVCVKTTAETITPMAEEFIPKMNVSAFTNDAGYLTLATLPKYGGEIV